MEIDNQTPTVSSSENSQTVIIFFKFLINCIMISVRSGILGTIITLYLFTFFLLVIFLIDHGYTVLFTPVGSLISFLSFGEIRTTFTLNEADALRLGFKVMLLYSLIYEIIRFFLRKKVSPIPFNKKLKQITILVSSVWLLNAIILIFSRNDGDIKGLIFVFLVFYVLHLGASIFYLLTQAVSIWINKLFDKGDKGLDQITH